MSWEKQSEKIGNIIARCWKDPSFKQKLLADPMETLKSEGIEVPSGLSVNVVENTDKIFNLVLPRNPKEELLDTELEGIAGGLNNPRLGGVETLIG